MILDKIFQEDKINFKMEEYDTDVTLYKVNKVLNVVEIVGDTSTFALDSDLFYYLDNQKIAYAFVLLNVNENKAFYLEFKDKKNWLASSFENSDKEELYFGKEVLNHQSDLQTIAERIKNYK